MKFKSFAVIGAFAILALGVASETAFAQGGPGDSGCANKVTATFLGGGSGSACVAYDGRRDITFAKNVKKATLKVDRLDTCRWFFRDQGGWTFIARTGGTSTRTFDSRPPHHKRFLVEC